MSEPFSVAKLKCSRFQNWLVNWELQDTFSEKTDKHSSLGTKSAESHRTAAGPVFEIKKKKKLEREA